MLGWLCLLGWLLLITVLAIMSAVSGDIISGFGDAFGWPSKSTNWTTFNIKLFAFWAISITAKVLIWGWW